MRKLALLLALIVIPAQAWALNVNDLLSTIALPLAVAAVSNAGVQNSQLTDLVTALNQANMPPQQIVEVIRYVPVTVYDQNGQPFVAYVKEETAQGVTGDALVNAIADRLRTNYNVTPVMTLDTEPTTFVLSDNFIPTASTMQLTGDPLSLIGLPLAVAAVSDIAGVPQDELGNLVATLNNANVPVVQEVQIIRYAPVALVDQNGQPFVAFVQQQVSQGVTGPALVPVVVQQLQTFFPPQTQIAVAAPAVISSPAPVQPQRVIVERDFAPPPVVISRVEELRVHPHGGPPGQLKKELGLQTGAEVVHGEKRGRQFTPAAVPPPAPVAVAPPPRAREEHGEEHGGGRGHGKRGEGAPAPMISSAPPPAAAPAPVVAAPPAAPPGQAKGHAEGGPGKEQDKGKGKGHGKD
jgi:hypothetical protein